jgi:ATP-dependent DNA helicase RecG
MSKKPRLKKQINTKDTSPYIHQNEKISFDLAIRELPWTIKQKEIIDTVIDKKANMTLIDGIWGSGKAQPLDSEVITPDGIKRMGDLSVGHYVCTPDGKIAPIIGIFPQGEKNIVKITFSDGSSAECCEDHLWKTYSTQQRNYRKKFKNSRETYSAPKEPSILTAKEIKETIFANKRGDLNHTIPMTAPVFFPEKELPLHPYVMGAL